MPQKRPLVGRPSLLGRSKRVFSAAAMLACTLGIAMGAASSIPATVTREIMLRMVVLAGVTTVCFMLGAFLVETAISPTSHRRAFWFFLAIVGLAFAACALPLSYVWMGFWKALSAASSGGATVIVGSKLIPYIPSARRGSIGGMIVLGACLGTMLSGVILPELLKLALMEPWIAASGFLLVAGSAI